MTESLKKYFKGDPVIWAVIIALTIISLLAVYSATSSLAYTKAKDSSFYMIKHFTFQFAGLMIIFVTHLIPYKYYSKLSLLFVLISIPLLLITLFIGRDVNDAVRTIRIPGGLTFQTSDFAKVALIMYIARFLSIKQENIKEFKDFFIALLPLILICGLILPANFSTAAILFGTCVILMFIGRVNFKHLFKLCGIAAALFVLYIALMLALGKEGRISTWLSRPKEFFKEVKTDPNSQVEKAKMAIADGGVFGKGPGNSVQRNFLPQPFSDFIYAIIIEEYGLIGGIILILLYLWLMFRAGVIVRKLDRTFPAFLAIGLILLIVFQALINMAVATSLFPVTGQTLPFVSRGGSSILFTGFALGVILSISRGPNVENLEPITNEVETEPSNELNNAESETK